MAILDENRIPVIQGVSNVDGVTMVAPYVNPTTHAILCSKKNGFAGSNNAKRDQNRVTGLIGISSADGITPEPIYIDSITKKLLITTL
jgi:ribosomal protein S6E (S10)